MSDDRYKDETHVKGLRFRDTRRLRGPSSKAHPTRPRVKDPSILQTPRRLRFQLADSEESFEVEVQKYMVVGRRADSHDQQVHIDFMPFSAGKHGVSRYHAVLIVTDKGLTITDVSSTNGTRLNNRMLEPGQGYLLKDGDELLLGQLRTFVYFLNDPPQDSHSLSENKTESE